jgi:ribonuclease E
MSDEFTEVDAPYPVEGAAEAGDGPGSPGGSGPADDAGPVESSATPRPAARRRRRGSRGGRNRNRSRRPVAVTAHDGGSLGDTDPAAPGDVVDAVDDLDDDLDDDDALDDDLDDALDGDGDDDTLDGDLDDDLDDGPDDGDALDDTLDGDLEGVLDDDALDGSTAGASGADTIDAADLDEIATTNRLSHLAETAPATPSGPVADAGPVAGAPQASAAAPTVPTPARPRIGDSRPRPAAPPPPARRTDRGAGAGTVGAGAEEDTEDDEDDEDAEEGTRTGEPGKARRRRRRRRGGRGRTRPGAGAGEGPEDDLGPATSLADIDEDLLKRRVGRTRKGRPTGRYMMAVHVQPGLATQVAVLEGRQLVEHYVSRPTDDTSNIFGNIYLGRVQNVLPGMEAAFIDIGTPKNGVLYRGDVLYDAADFEGERPRIEKVLRNGQSIMVQVTKNPIAHKGARLAQEISLAGRFVVMIPGQPSTFGISKRLPDDERKRLRKILDEIRPADAGLIVRTAAEGGTREELERDLRRLAHQWGQISDTAARSKAPKLLHKEPELAIRIIREEFNREYRTIVLDDPELFEDVRSYVESVSPELAERVELYDERLPLFERFHVSDQLAKALDRKVWLPSGGSIVIERTEALTVIDVNTGKNVGRSNLEETVFQNNLEAAEEIARQLRLRDVGGIIVIDFIDMEIKKNRDEVMRVFRDALARDKTRTQVFEISELGLVEMTRKRVAEDLLESFSHTCVACHGRGFVLDHGLLELD